MFFYLQGAGSSTQVMESLLLRALHQICFTQIVHCHKFIDVVCLGSLGQQNVIQGY